MQTEVMYAIIFGVVGTFLSVVMILQGFRRLLTDVEAETNIHTDEHAERTIEPRINGRISINDTNTNELYSFAATAAVGKDLRDRHVGFEQRSKDVTMPDITGSRVDAGNNIVQDVGIGTFVDDAIEQADDSVAAQENGDPVNGRYNEMVW